MSRMSSLEDLRKRQEKDEEEDKKENQYFAGGLDNRGGGSGLAVQAPGDPRNRAPAANEHELLHRIVERGMQDSRDNVGGANSGVPHRGSAPGGEGVQTIEITLFRNGFTVNNGPFREIHEPENQRFLHSLQRGEVPEEIARSSNGTLRELDVKLVSKIEEDYVPPPYVAFSGTAQTLGQVTNEAFVFSNDLLQGLVIPVLDESQPTINIQLRSHDNKRVKLRVNANITISSLAALILRELNLQAKSVQFTLSAGFPPKDVADPTITVSEAGFAGAAITLKLV